MQLRKASVWVLVSAASCLLISAALAQADIEVTDEIDWVGVLLQLFGGLALFLAGLEMLSEGLKKVAGPSLKTGLEKLTSNRFMAAITGAFVTAIINSSSVTTVLVVGFVTAGVMSLSQAVGVIMGANIGSTMTAQLLAFNLSSLALLGIAVGFFMNFTGKREQVRQYGAMIMGLGLVFFGMGVMSDGMKPLRSYEPFLDVLRSMEQPALGILVGAAFTALVQSSAATVGIAIAMASEGLLTLPAGISLALGANIGTCATALLAAMGKPVAAVRTAWVHVLFNVAGVLLWLPFIDQLAALAIQVSPSSDDLEGGARMAAEIPRQIANANTLFNIANTALFIGFAGVFAAAATRLIPDRPERKDLIIEPLYLDSTALKVPAIALEGVRAELARSGDITVQMLTTIAEAFRESKPELLDEVSMMHAQTQVLRSAMLTYLSHVGEQKLSEKEAAQHRRLMTSIMDLGNVSDIIAGSMSNLATRSMDMSREPSAKTREALNELYETTLDSVTMAVKAVAKEDAAAANHVVNQKGTVAATADQVIARKWERLSSEGETNTKVLELEIAVVDRLRQIYTLAKRMAKGMLPEDLPEE